ncbi:deoxyribonuclease IV [Candidatus Acetothermia bacterium]|nr:deoxyribonuclease IV [Candidatus Acetothermia bacterium]MCI2427061.1 deoxyribonuclease IV [Candidatus Acetothermia bacterium]MCI2428166.1 deoxyribonuclease IV [Candidatus Acetothermia bacterium]
MANDNLILGCHLSISQGFTSVIDAAEALGINALQIFSHNARSWKIDPISVETAESFQYRREASTICYMVIHTMYLINLASPEEKIYRHSIDSLRAEIATAGMLKIDHINTHIGSHKGSGVETGITRAVAALNEVIASPEFRDYKNVKILLENTAGTGTTIGTTFAELGRIINSLSDNSRVGISFDSCHGFAAGYELRTTAGLNQTLEECDALVGIERLHLIHLNDSQYPLAARRDRHQHIGQGEIGEYGFRLLINDHRLRHLPFILETPKEIDGKPNADQINLQTIRQLRTDEDSTS